MFSRVDRGGSREGKKSLRTNKIQIQEKLKLEKHKGSAGLSANATSAPPPPPLPCDCTVLLVDCGAQLLNRQFDRDQLKVINRGVSSGVQVMVAYQPDFDKVDALCRLAKEHAGVVYAMVGIHSNMIKTSNDKLSTARLDILREAAQKPETVALMTGLDFSRDVGIRYAQERALVQQLEVAAELALPVVLYELRAAEALAEKVYEFQSSDLPGASSIKIAIMNFAGTEEELTLFLGLGCHIMVNGKVCEAGERGDALRAMLAASCPLDKLLLASDSPHTTPQNISDVFVREGRNEPSNLPHLLDILAPVYHLPPADIATHTHANALSFLGIPTAATATDAPPCQSSDGGVSAPAGEQGTVGPAPVGDGEDNQAPDAAGGDGPSDESEEQAGVRGPNTRGGGDKGMGGSRMPVAAAAGVRDQRAAARSFLDHAGDVGSSSGGGGGGGAEVMGLRAAYACRNCRSLLYSERDVVTHDLGQEGLTRTDFTSSSGKAQGKKGKGRRGDIDAQHTCTMHFLQPTLRWLQAACSGAPPTPHNNSTAPSASQHQGGGLEEQEGRLDCPCCSTKLGKWAVQGDGITCSCGIVVPPLSFSVLRARMDIVDLHLDLGQAVQTGLTLRATEEAEGMAAMSSSDDDDWQGKKKHKKKMQKNKTANFTSFRNKTWTASVKQQASTLSASGSHGGAAGGGQVDDE